MNVPANIEEIIRESLRDWFKKEKWVRISSSGNIAGPCGTSKNKKNPDRCLPKAKAQSLTKGQRAATARKKKKAGAKGKTVVKNTKKATVKKEGLWANINAKKKAGKKSSHGNSNAYKDAKKAGKALKGETKGAPKGHYFTKSGNLVKGRLTKDARERGARLSDPKDKQRSKVPPVTQYKEERIYSDSKIEDRLVQLAQDIGREKFAMHILYDLPSNLKRAVLDALDASKGGIYDLEPVAAENVAPNHNDKAAPYGSGYKKADKFAGSDPKAGSTIKGTGFDWKRVTKEDIRNLVVGLMNEDQDEVLMEKDDRCTRIAKRKYDTWPSAYASGAVVRCRRGEIWKKEK